LAVQNNFDSLLNDSETYSVDNIIKLNIPNNNQDGQSMQQNPPLHVLGVFVNVAWTDMVM